MQWLKCLVGWHSYQPYTLLGKLGNYPIMACRCGRFRGRSSGQSEGNKS